MKRKFLSIIIVIAMILTLLVPVKKEVKATTFIPVIYPQYFPIDCSTSTTTPGDGTPFAVYIEMVGYNVSSVYTIKSRIGFGTSLGYAISWKNATANTWANDSTAYTSLLPITTDSSGNWKGWLVAKVQNTVTPGTLNYKARMRLSGTTTNIDSSQISATSLNMSTQGGWIEGSATLNGSPAQNKVVVVKNGTTIIGIYLTEDNGVNEGYSSTPGYFKVGVPVGGPYTLELWNTDNTVFTGTATVDSVTAGNVTTGVSLTVTGIMLPTVQTNDATNVTGTSCTLNGNITDLGGDTSANVYFQYGPDTNYGTETTHQAVASAGVFTADLTALTPGATYHFRAVATNSSGTAYGADKVFVPSLNPVVVSVSPAISATGIAVNTAVSATFDRDMDATTITTDTFILKDSLNNPVTGTVSYNSSTKTATFSPDSLLQENTTYTATLTTGMQDTSANPLSSDYSWSFTTEALLTISAARALSTGTQVYIQGNVTVPPGKFNRGFAIQDATGGIYVYPASQPVGISLSDVVQAKGTLKNYNGLLELDPVTLVNRISSGTCPDPVDKLITEIGESTEGLLARVSGTVVSITGTTNKTVTINDGVNSLQIYVYGTTGISISQLVAGDYITVTGFSGQYDSASPYDSGYQVQPRFQSDILVNKPQVVSTNPQNGATGVSFSSTISATFDRALDASTVSTSTFTVKDSENNLVTGSVSYDSGTYTVTFTPSAPLTYDFYTATLSGSIKDTDGNPMNADYSWTFSTITFETPCPTTPFMQSSDNSLKVFAVMYNSLESGLNEKGEALCLINTGSTTLDLSDYVVTDFEGAAQFPTGTTLAPNTKIWLAREATEFKAEFNKEPDYEYGSDSNSSIPNFIQVSGAYPIFDNTGDECAVFDASNNIVDVVAWGTSDYANTGWAGATITPYIFADYIFSEGDITVRKLNEITGQPVPDTNTLNDWSWDGTDPIDGCKITYPGWDSWDTFFFTPKATATVHTTFFVSPDNSFAATGNFIDSATSSIKIELYTITSLDLMNKVLARMDAGVDVEVLMDGEVYGATGGTYDQVRWFVTQVYNKGGEVYFLRSASPHDRYNNVHIKTIIVDNSKVLITADNLTNSSMPCDNFLDGTAGNRGSGVITDDPVIVQGVLNIFNHDFQPGYYDVSPYNPATDAPPSGYTPPPSTNQSGYYPIQPTPLTVNETEYLELVDSSDTSMRSVDSIIGLINEAGAGDIIIDEAQYEDLYWGPTGQTYINPRLQAMISAAQRGAQVYLILDSVYSADTNTPTKTYMESQSSNIHVLLGNPSSGNGSFPIHNKMILARIGGLGYVNVASINGSENASRANRELGLIVQSNAGFEYYYKMFAADWAVSGGTTYTLSTSISGNGSIVPMPMSDKYLPSENVTLTAVPDAGWHFVSWSGDVSGTTNPVTITMDSNKTVTGTFAINTYTVTFNSEGGSAVPQLTDVPYNSTITEPTPAPTRTGYTFGGWYKEAGCTTAWNFDSDTVTSNITLYAKWTINTYTITATAGLGGSIPPSGTVSVNYGDSKTFTITPNTGYHIVDVKVDNVSQGAITSYTFTSVTANHTIDATFAIDTFTITASSNSGGTISPSGSVIVNYGSSPTFTITPNPGYFLSKVLVDGVIVYPVGMTANATGSYTYTFINVTADHTIQAVFAPGILQYVITATAGTGGLISPSGIVMVPQFGSQTFTITPDANYHIYYVLVDGSSVMSELVNNGDGTYSYTFNNVDNNHTIEAYFEHNYIKTTAPLGNEIFSPTDTLHVTWEVAGFTGTEGKIRVLFFGDANSDTKWTTVVDNLPIANGSYTIDLSKFNIADPLRCKVRVGVYNPDTGLWLTWTSGTQSGTYIDETGYFWVISQ